MRPQTLLLNQTPPTLFYYLKVKKLCHLFLFHYLQNKLLFFILPKTYKQVKSSIGTLVLDIDGNLYEIPNLNYLLSVNILSGLGVNTRTLTMSEVISNAGSCRIDLAGNWMHKVNGIEIRGCPFNSISKKMLQQGSHRNSRDYKSYKAVFEEIDRKSTRLNSSH